MQRDTRELSRFCGTAAALAAERDEAERFYGERLQDLFCAEEQMLCIIEQFRLAQKAENGFDPVDHCKSRIKQPDSMKRKLQLRGLPPTLTAALTEVKDAVGVRAICYFIDDVYAIARHIEEQTGWRVIKVRDYIAHPKPNGYRSYHLVMQIVTGAAAGIYVEVQIRTIAIDCWASLEHVLKYKKDIAQESLMKQELKRCADELASTDLSMQTLRDIILENNTDEEEIL